MLSRSSKWSKMDKWLRIGQSQVPETRPKLQTIQKYKTFKSDKTAQYW